MAWRPVDGATTMGVFPVRHPEALGRRLLVGAGNVPPAMKALLAAAAAEGRRCPVVLGPPAGGEDTPGELSSMLQKDGKLEICSLPLLRLINKAVERLGGPMAVLLRAEPQERRVRLWLAPAGGSLEELEAPALPAGVGQLSSAALAAEAAQSWAAASDGDMRGALATIVLAGDKDGKGTISIPVHAVSPALRATIAAGARSRVPLVFGPPNGGEKMAGGVRVILREEGGLRINSAPLIRLLREAREAAAAAGAEVEVRLRAEPQERRVRMWLAPAGSEGEALPAGVTQISEAGISQHVKVRGE